MFRQKISTIKDKGLRKRLEELLSEVTRALRTTNFTGEFYIAGGCVFDILTNNKASSDVDVFVYDVNALDALLFVYDVNAPIAVEEKFVRMNTALEHNRVLHINRVHVGQPEGVFEQFDLMNSMVAITSTGELLKHKDFSYRVRVNLDAVNNYTFSRYFDYVVTKGALDPDEAALRKIIDYIVDNPFKCLGYGEVPHTVEAINSLAATMYREVGLSYHSQYIHDRIVKRHSNEDRIPIFKRLVLYCNFNVDKPCTELALVKLINLREYIDTSTLINGWGETYQEVTNKYPEYFI